MSDPRPADRVRRTLARWRAEGLGPGVVAAVSGGSDSVALLVLLHGLAPELGLDLTVAHLNHGVRGEAAGADARFVADLAARLNLPFELGSWSPRRPAHFEADARRARHAWLAEVARRRGASAVALGHTRDDQAETILHRILRGTGPRGLAGIPARRRLAEGVALIRPLLNTSREALRRHLRAIGQDWREDASNDDTARTRSRLRHDLLPRLAGEYNPAVVAALVRLGRLTAGLHGEFDALLEPHAAAVVASASPDAIVLRRDAFAALPPFAAVELLRGVWRRAGWPESAMDESRWRRLRRFVRRGEGRRSVGGGITAREDGGLIQLIRGERPTVEPPGPIALPVPGVVNWDGREIAATLDLSAAGGEWIDRDRLNLDAAAPALIVRAAGPGDRFDPLGLDGHTRPLNDFFRGRGVAREDRPRVPLVCDRAGIVWVVGHRIAHRVRLTGDTRVQLGLRVGVVAGRTRPGPACD